MKIPYFSKLNKKQKGNVFMIIGAIILLLAYTSYTSEREAKPMFDGVQNDFDLSFVDMAERAEVGQTFWVDVEVDNPLENSGTMYVQCSIFDKAAHTDFLMGAYSVTYLDTDENCVDDEPFTQTAQVTLDSLQHKTVRLSMQVPDVVGGTPVIYCEAYEQCWAEDTNTMTSSMIQEPLDVVRADKNDANNNPDEDSCVADKDCKWLGLIGDQVCVDGLCIDEADDPSSDTLIEPVDPTQWMKDNIALTIIIGFGIMMIGMVWVYQK